MVDIPQEILDTHLRAWWFTRTILKTPVNFKLSSKKIYWGPEAFPINIALHCSDYEKSLLEYIFRNGEMAFKREERWNFEPVEIIFWECRYDALIKALIRPELILARCVSCIFYSMSNSQLTETWEAFQTARCYGMLSGKDNDIEASLLKPLTYVLRTGIFFIVADWKPDDSFLPGL
jgi:hypothetical protein